MDCVMNIYYELKKNKYLPETTTQQEFNRYLYAKYFQYCMVNGIYKSNYEFLLNWSNSLYIEALNNYIIDEKELYNSITGKNYTPFFKGFNQYVSEFMKYYDEYVQKIEKEFFEKYNDRDTDFLRL